MKRGVISTRAPRGWCASRRLSVAYRRRAVFQITTVVVWPTLSATPRQRCVPRFQPSAPRLQMPRPCVLLRPKTGIAVLSVFFVPSPGNACSVLATAIVARPRAYPSVMLRRASASKKTIARRRCNVSSRCNPAIGRTRSVDPGVLKPQGAQPLNFVMPTILSVDPLASSLALPTPTSPTLLLKKPLCCRSQRRLEELCRSLI